MMTRLFAFMLLLACLASGTAFAAEEQTQGVLDLRLTASVEGEDAQEINSVLDSSAIDIAIGADMAGDPVVNVKADGMGMMLFRLLLKTCHPFLLPSLSPQISHFPDGGTHTTV